MGSGPAYDKTIITGITGSDEFAQSRQQWSTLVRHQGKTAKDEYHYHLDVGDCDPSGLLARITRKHAESPLLAGRDARVAPFLRRALGYDGNADVWSTYSGAPHPDGTAVFSAIERCPTVLLFAEYKLRPLEPDRHRGDALTPGVAVDVHVHVTTYLFGWQHYAWPLLFPLLRSLVRGAVTLRLVGDLPHAV